VMMLTMDISATLFEWMGTTLRLTSPASKT
jgi:hypothetical protein